MRQEKINLRQEQYQETRSKLLDSALKLFAQNGYAGTQVRTINRSIGLADGLMYHYFPGGKKEILQVLIRENFQNIVAELHDRGAGLTDLPVDGALEQVYRNADQVFTENLNLFRILIMESGGHELLEHEKMQMMLRNLRQWLPNDLRRRAKAREIKEIDYESASEILIALMMDHFMKKLTNLAPARLSDPDYRKRLIAYQVGLWKNPQLLG